MAKGLRSAFCLVIACSIVLGGCKKYPDGPLLSLKSKKARLAGEWLLEQVLRNGHDTTEYYKAYLGSNYKLIIKKHGVYYVEGNFPGDGKWRLDDRKELIYFTPTGGVAPETAYEIRRLKSRSLWIRNTDEAGNVTESRYIQ